MRDEPRRTKPLNQPATRRQLLFIRAVARELGLNEETVNAAARERYGAAVANLSRRDAAAFIDHLYTTYKQR